MWPQPDWVRIADLFVQYSIQFAFAALLAVITGVIGYQVGIRADKSKEKTRDDSAEYAQVLDAEAKSAQRIRDQLTAGLDDPARELQRAKWLRALKTGEKVLYILAVTVIGATGLIGLFKGQSGGSGPVSGRAFGHLSYGGIVVIAIGALLLAVFVFYVLSSQARRKRFGASLTESFHNFLSFLKSG